MAHRDNGNPTSAQIEANPLAQYGLTQPLQTQKYRAQTIISFDPGVVCTGAAVNRNGVVTLCRLMPRMGKSDLFLRSVELRTQVETLWRQVQCFDNALVLIEYPQIYVSRIRRGETREDPKHLIDIALLCGVIVSVMSQSFDCRLIHPAEWKGQVDKDVMIDRIVAHLTPQERQLIPGGALAHNGIDAMGITLKACGRL